MPAKPIPEGLQSMTARLVFQGAARLIGFLVAAFGAKVIERTATPGRIYLDLPDVDTTDRRALGAGAMKPTEPAEQFYGDRQGAVRDSAGNVWRVATHAGGAH